MNLVSEHARAIKGFLDAINYQEWEKEVIQVVADMPGERFSVGVLNFKNLANSIGYLYSDEETPSDQPENQNCNEIDALRCDVCGKSLEYLAERGEKTTITGIEISLIGATEQVNAPYTNGTYRICYSCWLKSLGIKPRI